MRVAVIARGAVAALVSLGTLWTLSTLSLVVPNLTAQTRPDVWLTYGQNSLGWRYSELTEIDTSNVARLTPRWIFQTGLGGGLQTTPLVFDGLMFMTGPSNHSWALDALTGRQVWHYRKAPPGRLNLCCGEVNRGFAVHGDKLFRVNIEGTLVALDIKSGTRLWETKLADYKQGYSATAAP